MPRITGYTVWKGASWIDGAPIVAIVTLRSSNKKTGDMAQLWILREDISPVEAVATGGDASICGSCVHRGSGFKQRSCYVDVGKAPSRVWDAYKRGMYPAYDINLIGQMLAGSKVRLGAYGDPSVVPVGIIYKITESVRMWTGYTHQWRRKEAEGHKHWCMASCETRAEVDAARAAGWRVFYVGEEVMDGHKSTVCPASDEGGHRTTCNRCGLCAGAAIHRDSVASVITIRPHGSGRKSLPVKVALTVRASES